MSQLSNHSCHPKSSICHPECNEGSSAISSTLSMEKSLPPFCHPECNEGSGANSVKLNFNKCPCVLCSPSP